MKNKVMLISFLFLIFASYFAVSVLAEVKVCEEGDDNCKIDNAYSCLNDQITSKTCSKMAPDEKVFSLITAGKCKAEVESDSKYKSDIRYTSLAVLGGATGKNVQDWLISKNRTTTNLDWFLQIDTIQTGDLKCKITYGTSSQDAIINENKIVTSVTGGCLTKDLSGYWLKFGTSCIGQEISVSCDKPFTTNLLYQKQGSSLSTIYVSDETHQSSAGGKTVEKVQSLCFGTSGCDYEGSLWAALVLNSKNYDVSPYLPYLVTNMEDNEKFLPEAFLYPLSGDFGNEILSKQVGDKWWQEGSSNDKFYDTALALYSIQNDNSLQMQNSVRWLLDEAQGANGCWNNGDIRDTAFLLYAIEPRTSSGVPIESNVDCESAKFNCMSGISCSQVGGNVLSSYICSGTFVCCDKAKVLLACVAQGGELCSSTQRCAGGDFAQSSDSSTSQTCCVGGTCEIRDDTPQISECVSSGGECRVGSCSSGETESFQACEFNSDICCVAQQKSGVSAAWIVVLLVLITLVVIGIIFREKLKHLWFRIKSRYFSGSASMYHGGGRPSPPSPPFFGRNNPFQQRPAPVHQGSRPATGSRPRGELDEVLRKLRDMGK